MADAMKNKIICFLIHMARATDAISNAMDALAVQFGPIKSCHGFVSYFKRTGRIELCLSHLMDLRQTQSYCT